MAVSTMVCLYCQKKIGSLRRLRDSKFCCADHRKKLTSKSARALREAEDLYGFDQVSWRSITQVKPEEKTERRSPYGAAIFISLGVMVILMALSRSPGAAPVAKAVSPLPTTGALEKTGGFGGVLANLIPSKAGTWRDDFGTGLENWDGTTGTAWIQAGSEVRPTSLRLWKPSASLSNYELEFMGQIERKGIDWAFRALDVHNYYATKLIIAKPGVTPNAGLVRFLVLNGKERERVELPLPLTLEPRVDYRVRVSIRGDRFLTSVNGQLISSWTDNRLSRGGVGFFSEDGESALLKWVSVSERDSLIGRIASHFSLITFPTQIPAR